MLRTIIFFYSLMAPILCFSQEIKMTADEYFSVAKGITYPAKYGYTTITRVDYPKANSYVDSGITIIEGDRIYINSKSSTVISGNLGTLNLNHESKIAVFSPSDSFMKEIVSKFPDMYEDKTDYSEITPYLERAQNSLYTPEQEEFIRNSCSIVQKRSNDRNEITVIPKSKTNGYFIFGRLVLDQHGKLIEMETSYRDVYARDIDGGEKYRIVTQKNTHYKYSSVAPIPVKLSDFVECKNWKVKLKKYSDYKLDVL